MTALRRRPGSNRAGGQSRRDGIGLRSERGPVLAALLLSMCVIALDGTVIATAVPSVVDDLGGFSEFPWIFSIYLLAQGVSVPIFAKFADLFGRKPVALLGLATFGLGSILCGLAWTMPALIVFRAVQGIGAGALQPTAMTIIGDMYTLQERAKVQAYMGTSWGVSSVLGPTIGGLFSEYVSWRWIFFINIPICCLAAFLLYRALQERRSRTRRGIDYVGGAMLAAGCFLLLLGVLEGGQSWPWDSALGVGVPLAGVCILAAFGYVETRSDEPTLPLWVFRRRHLVTISLVSAALGAILLGVTSYIPTFVQTVRGTGPVLAGFALATVMIGWPLAGSQSGRIYLRHGFRRSALIGSVIAVAASAMLLLIDSATSVLQVAVSCFVLGVGLGLIAAPTLVAAQSSVAWADRGVVTGNVMFARALGSALGVAIFGAVANSVTGHRDPTPAAIARSSHEVFIGVTVAAVLMLVAAICMPRRTPTEEDPHESDERRIEGLLVSSPRPDGGDL